MPSPDNTGRALAAPRERFVSRRWWAQYEGQISPASERLLLLVVAYLIGGLGYVGVNRLVGEGTFHRLALPLDGMIPFVPVFVFAYVMVYVTPAFSVFLIRDRAEFYRTFLAFGLNAVICYSIFLIFPVEYPRLYVIPHDLSGRFLSFVQVLDRPVNCFPSHHISTAFTTFFAVRRQHRGWGAVFGVIAVLIALSTLFVKQHYLVDVPAGIGVAWLTYILSFPSQRPA
jgi:membrane-associated phospholipid phosphatase